MKKIYLTPQTIVVNVELEGRLLDGSLKIDGSQKSEVSEGGFTKDQGSWGNIWDDEE